MAERTVHLIDGTRTPPDLMTACGLNTKLARNGHTMRQLRTISSPLIFNDAASPTEELCMRCMSIWRARDLSAVQSTPVKKMPKDPFRDSVRYGTDEEFQAVISSMDLKDLPDAFIGLTTAMLYQLAEGLGLKMTLVVQPKGRL